MKYALKRVLLLIPVLLGVSLLSFTILRLIPGDPAVILAGDLADEKLVQTIRQEYGLDQSLPAQYLVYMGKAVRGDFGISIKNRAPINQLLAERFVFTLKLALLGIGFAVVLGILSGVVSATKPYSIFDNLSTLAALAGISVPIFWLGLILILVFSVWLHWLPSGGADTWRHLILPAVALGASAAAIIARMTRASMLEVLRQDYIRTARAYGFRELAVNYRYALKNAMIPVITVLGLQFGYLLSGAILTETVFALPGIGRLMVDSISSRDYPVVQSAMLVVATTFVIINLLTDLTYSLLDPRIRYK